VFTSGLIDTIYEVRRESSRSGLEVDECRRCK